MNALYNAKELIQAAYFENYDMAEVSRHTAVVYAAIAQAEALQRIADALDILAHPNRIIAPDPQDYQSEDEYNEAAERYDYYKNSNPGQSMDEYKSRIAVEPY